MHLTEPPDPANGSYTVRYAHGAFWSLIGTVGARLSGFLGAVIIARFLGQVGFGELAMIQSTLGLLGTFAGLGIGLTATKYVAELKNQNPERTGRIIGLTYLVSWIVGGSMALFCILAAPWIASSTINAPHLVPELRLASILLLLSAGFGPQQGILAGLQAFKAIARINWWQGLSSLGLTVPLVWWAGLRGAIIAMIFSHLLGAILSSLALAGEYRNCGIRPKFRKAWREAAILWRLSLPVFLNSTLMAPVTWAANAILANQPSGYAELGLFRAAMQYQFIIVGVSTILSMVSVPLLVEIHGGDDRERFARAFNVNLHFNWSVALFLGFVLLPLSPWLAGVFGAKFAGLSAFLPLIICLATLNVACNLSGQAFFSAGRMWTGLLTSTAWAAIFLALAHFFIPTYGCRGLAVAFLISYALVLVLQLGLSIIIIKQPVFRNQIIPIAFSILLIFSTLSRYYINNFIFNILCIFLIFLSFYSLITKYKSQFNNIVSHFYQSYLLKFGSF